MPHQEVSTDLTTVMTTGITTTLTKSCGKDTGTIGAEVRETSDPTKIITVNGIVANCPDPVA